MAELAKRWPTDYDQWKASFQLDDLDELWHDMLSGKWQHSKV